MANKDINLFNAGGERTKTSKRSPMTYMVIFALVVIVAAVGVLVFFNMRANNAKSDYEKKITIRDNYNRTISYVTDWATEYQEVHNNILAAAAINGYVEYASALYPHITEGELAAVKNTVLNNMLGESFSLNEAVEGEPFTPWDYNGLRESLYEEGAEEITERELFYFGLQKLADEQEDRPEVGVWYTYYRCYLLIVFTGGDGMGLPSLIETMVSESGTMEGNAPFSRFEMVNDTYTNGYYTPAKYLSKVYNEETYNVLLLPVKSAFERAFDILIAHSAALLEQGDNVAPEYSSFGVNEFKFTNDALEFVLTLPKDSSFKSYMDSFDASVFFEVPEDVMGIDGVPAGDNIQYNVKLNYRYKAKSESDDAE